MSWDDERDYFDDGDAAAVTLDCPNCGEEVYEEAEQCPSCGEWIVHSTSPWQGRSTWWVLLGIAGVLATVAVLSGLLVR